MHRSKEIGTNIEKVPSIFVFNIAIVSLEVKLRFSIEPFVRPARRTTAEFY